MTEIQDEFTGKGTPQQRQRWRNRELSNLQSLRSNRKRRRERPEQHLFFIARGRARKNKLDFDITPEDIVIPDLCPIRQVPLSFLGDVINNPSLDRVDNSKGYVKGNVRVISRKANMWKNDMSVKDIEVLYSYVTS